MRQRLVTALIPGALAFVAGTAVSAEESWLLVTSEPPEARISVDDIYRGTTPRTRGDTLRIAVPVGKRQLKADWHLGSRVESDQKTIEVKPSKGMAVHLRLQEEPIEPTPMVPVVNEAAVGFTGPAVTFALPKLLVPSRNF